MTALGISHGVAYSTVYISGLPPFGLRLEHYRALGSLAAEVRADQAARVVRLPAERVGQQGAGWSITAPTSDIARIQSVAQDILDGKPTSLAAKYRTPTEQEAGK